MAIVPFVGVGAVPRVRLTRASFSPRQIAGLGAWYKADAITGKNDGDTISQWDDSSGSGRHATQGTAANQPTYKTAVINGKPVVRFDGVNDVLAVSTLFAAGTNQALTICCVAKPGGAGSSGGRMIAGNANNWLFGPRADSGGWAVFNGSFTSPIPAVTADSTRILSMTQTAGATNMWINGTLAGSHTGASVTAPGGFTFGEGEAEFDDSDIAEIVIYTAVLSTADRQRVQRYLGAKYAITVA